MNYYNLYYFAKVEVTNGLTVWSNKVYLRSTVVKDSTTTPERAKIFSEDEVDLRKKEAEEGVWKFVKDELSGIRMDCVGFMEE
jgi:hypothetical protein